jgi:putative membrane protein
MLILILFLIVGGVMVYLAQNNLMLVTLYLGTYAFSNIPLFYIIIGSLLTGLGLAYFIYLINSIFIAFSMHRKDSAIKHGKSDIVDLTKRIHQLELENERLKNNSTVVETPDNNAL